jgi:hypothetical protein
LGRCGPSGPGPRSPGRHPTAWLERRNVGLRGTTNNRQAILCNLLPILHGDRFITLEGGRPIQIPFRGKKISVSEVAQGERAGPITQRSTDRNRSSLNIFLLIISGLFVFNKYPDGACMADRLHDVRMRLHRRSHPYDRGRLFHCQGSDCPRPQLLSPIKVQTLSHGCEEERSKVPI